MRWSPASAAINHNSLAVIVVVVDEDNDDDEKDDDADYEDENDVDGYDYYSTVNTEIYYSDDYDGILSVDVPCQNDSLIKLMKSPNSVNDWWY